MLRIAGVQPLGWRVVTVIGEEEWVGWPLERAPAELEVVETDTGERVRSVLLSFKATAGITQVVNKVLDSGFVVGCLFVYLERKSNHCSRVQLLSYNS